MAQQANTVSTYDINAIREQLSDAIWRMGHEKTPFLSAMGRETVRNRLCQWQTEGLEAVDLTNAVIEGDEATNDAVVATVSQWNTVQLMDKVINVSSTADAVDIAGKMTETGHQIAKKGIGLKKDMEAIMLNNQASVTGNDTTARKLGGFPAFLTTNVNRGATGASGGSAAGVVTAATDGTLRALSMATVSDMFTTLYEAGSEPEIVQVSPKMKQRLSNFLLGTGAKIATVTRETPERGQAAAIAAVDYYESDFGPKRIKVNIHQRVRDVFIVDYEYLAVGVLQPFRDEPLAKTGHSNRRMLSAEVTLIVKNEAAHGVIADIDNTLAVVA